MPTCRCHARSRQRAGSPQVEERHRKRLAEEKRIAEREARIRAEELEAERAARAAELEELKRREDERERNRKKANPLGDLATKRRSEEEGLKPVKSGEFQVWAAPNSKVAILGPRGSRGLYPLPAAAGACVAVSRVRRG
jgi:hypothetical protein